MDTHKKIGIDIAGRLFLAGALIVVAVLIQGMFAGGGSVVFTSAEVAFTDASASGLAIVPASCPSSPHYIGQCDTSPLDVCPNIARIQLTVPSGWHLEGGQCVLDDVSDMCPNIAGIQTTVPSGYHRENGQCFPNTIDVCPNLYGSQASVPWGYHLVNGQCVQLSCPTGWTVQGNQCVPPPPPTFVSFTGNIPGGSGGSGGSAGTFAASGHLVARPLLVQQGETSQLYWSVTNVSSCTVTATGTGANAADVWTTSSSGADGVQTSQLFTKSVYTLTCQSLPGATPASVSESRTINVIPTFEEQ